MQPIQSKLHRAARYINDSPPNFCKIFLAIKSLNKKIPQGTELRYNYDDREERMTWREDDASWNPRQIDDCQGCKGLTHDDHDDCDDGDADDESEHHNFNSTVMGIDETLVKIDDAKLTKMVKDLIGTVEEILNQKVSCYRMSLFKEGKQGTNTVHRRGLPGIVFIKGKQAFE
uniref:SET domain-containing protein n=1 Tax=Clytia hemisphaerica TaxID=252671 RepID=A0A7M5UFE7_9CNID